MPKSGLVVGRSAEMDSTGTTIACKRLRPNAGGHRDAGGAGFEKPANRPRAEALADVGEGLVSPGGAREVYGVEVPAEARKQALCRNTGRRAEASGQLLDARHPVPERTLRRVA